MSLAQVCRLCLKENDESLMVQTSNTDYSHPEMVVLNGNNELVDIIHTMTSLKVLQTPIPLIQFVCVDCKRVLDEYSAYRSRCIVNNAIFRNKFQPGTEPMAPVLGTESFTEPGPGPAIKQEIDSPVQVKHEPVTIEPDMDFDYEQQQ